MFPPPCLHNEGNGLCPECQDEYDEDPSAYIEFGNHPAGIANWMDLRAKMATLPHELISELPDSDIPF